MRDIFYPTPLFMSVSIPHQRWGLYDCWPLKGALSQSESQNQNPSLPTNNILPELSNFRSPPAEPGVYLMEIKNVCRTQL